ncbi:MAG TPA: WYL domain-containing protein [Myxococcota bacterium]|nr:WYL domain-containing protein [Myxococcota bacterium]
MRGDQLARQWRLIQRLARSRAGVGLEDLASDLECTRRTVYRDLDALQFAGFPVTSERRDGRVFYRFVAGFQLDDVPFTPDEVLALAFSEDLLRTLEGTVFHDSVRSALAKIRAALSPELAEFLSRLGESFRVLPGPHKSYASQRDTIQKLNEAVLARRTVEMRYRTGSTGAVSTRSLDPYRVWYRGGALYVVGHDHKSGEIRTFAVDRIERLRETDGRFAVPASFDFDAYLGASFGVIAEPASKVRIRFERRWAGYVAERTWHPSQRVRPLPGGALELEMEVGGTAELRSWVLSFGSGALVLEPETLRDEVVRELRAAVARYDAPGPEGRTAAPSARKDAAVTKARSAAAPGGAARRPATGADGPRR